MLKFVPGISICERYTILDFYVFIMEGGILTVYQIEPRTFGLEVQRAILCANGTPL